MIGSLEIFPPVGGPDSELNFNTYFIAKCMGIPPNGGGLVRESLQESPNNSGLGIIVLFSQELMKSYLIFGYISAKGWKMHKRKRPKGWIDEICMEVGGELFKKSYPEADILEL